MMTAEEECVVAALIEDRDYLRAGLKVLDAELARVRGERDELRGVLLDCHRGLYVRWDANIGATLKQDIERVLGWVTP